MTTTLEDQRFVIGIDLGTTNCAVAYVDRSHVAANNRVEPDRGGLAQDYVAGDLRVPRQE